jgi:hypothetical protein
VIVRATLACLLTLAALAPASPASVSGLPEPMTQRLIVKFRPPTPGAGIETESVRGAGRVSRLAADSGVALAYVRPMALGAHVVAFDHPVPLSRRAPSRDGWRAAPKSSTCSRITACGRNWCRTTSM